MEQVEQRRVLSRLFDLDRDSDLDVLDGLVWYENYDGHGNFAMHVVRDRRAPDSIAADLDRDGDVDLLTREPRWFQNNGDNQFVLEHRFPGEAQQLTELELFDVGGDGDTDVIGYTGTRDRAYLFENRDGTFVERTVKDMAEGDIDVGDFDLDGRLDTLVIEHLDYITALAEDPTPRDLQIRSLWIELDRGDGNIERQMLLEDTLPALAFPAEGPGTPGWDSFIRELQWRDDWFGRDLADIDGDGWLDLVYGTYQIGSNYLPLYWRRNDHGALSQQGDVLADEGHGRSYLRDVDQDGDLDALSEDNLGSVLILMLNDDGAFSLGGFLSQDLPFPEDVGDINGDGLLDQLVGIQEGVPVWLDAVTGEPHVDGYVPPPVPVSATVFIEHELHSESSRMLRPADFDGDGKLDFLANPSVLRDHIWVSDVDGDRVYTMAQVIPDSRALFYDEPVFVDFDDDGDVDILSPDTIGGASEGYSVVLFENTDGLGTFQQRELGLIVSDRSPVRLMVADVDNDRDQDLITVDRRRLGTADLQLHLNVEGSYVTQAIGRGFSRAPADVALADVDRDGDVDVVVSEGAVVWYENERGQFTEHTAWVAVDGSIDLADMDRDGDLDLIVARETSVYLFANQDREFSLHREIPYLGGELVAVADVEGDGDLDIAVQSPKTIDWFENQDGAFIGPRAIDRALIGFTDVDVLDWGADGDLDVNTRAGNDWSLHENRRVGDVNDDGVFNSTDLLEVLQAGTYESGIPHDATFDEGDWNQDGYFDSSDLVFAFQTATYTAALPLDSRLAAAVDLSLTQRRRPVPARLGKMPLNAC